MSWWDNLKSTLPNVNAGFDPEAMGLTPLYSTDGGVEQGTSTRALTGYSKRISANQAAVYSPNGDFLGNMSTEGGGWMGKHGEALTKGAIAAMGAMAFAPGLGGAAGGAGDAGAGMGWMGGADGVGLGTMGDALVVPGTVGATGLGAAGAGAAGSTVAPTIASAAAPVAAGAGAANSWMLPAAIAGSSLLGANAATKAAETQADAQTQANKLLYDMYRQQRTDLQPFVTAGTGAQNQLLTYLGLPGGAQGANFGKYARDFNQNDMVTDPGYAFRLSEGQKALDRQAAARGGLISGGALKAATRYGQDMGSQEYSNAYNRYQTNRQNQLAPLFALTGSGQASAANQAAAAGNYGTAGAAGLTNIGAANAAGTVGTTNALTAGLGSYLNYSSNQDMVNALTRRTGYGVT